MYCLSHKYLVNIEFFVRLVFCLYCVTCLTLLSLRFIIAGDFHPNPGPSTSLDFSSISQNSFEMNSQFLTKHQSFCQLQGLMYFQQRDLIQDELSDFDILAFSEIWLNQSISTDNLKFVSFSEPEWKDCLHDSHGGVLLYIINNIRYRCTYNLEPLCIDCIWV